MIGGAHVPTNRRQMPAGNVTAAQENRNAAIQSAAVIPAGTNINAGAGLPRPDQGAGTPGPDANEVRGGWAAPIQNLPQQPTDEERATLNAAIAERNTYIRALEEEIAQIDSESLRCARTKKSWKTATIIGGIGTVATGIGAAVQASQISKAKKEGKVFAEPTETKTGTKNE